MKKKVQDVYSEILRLRNLFYQKWIESAETDEPSGYIRTVLSAKYEAFNKALELLSPSIVDPQPKDSGELTHSVTKISDQEEPVSEELEAELDVYIKSNFIKNKAQLDRLDVEKKYQIYAMYKSDMLAMVHHFANWQKQKDSQSREIKEVRTSYDCGFYEGYKKGRDKTKHQMMKAAIDAQVVLGPNDNHVLMNGLFNNYKHHDKVKLIIIKED